MTNLSIISARTVLIADLNPLNVETSIRAAIKYYIEVYGEPKRVWVNPKDIAEGQFDEIEGMKIERRGGCQRLRIMVF